MRKHPTNQFDLLCSKCGNTNYIQRSTNKTPKLLDTENSWCPYCEQTTLQYIIGDRETINYLLENKNELTYKEQKVYPLRTSNLFVNHGKPKCRIELSKHRWYSRKRWLHLLL